jgi:VWFA-related protein
MRTIQRLLALVTHRSRRVAAPLVCASLLILTMPGVAQEASGPVVFQEVLDVRVVNVEVVVTDRQGVRVQDLGVDDFRLLVDGEEVAIDYFSEILGGQVVDRPPRSAAAETAGEVGLVPALEAGGAVGTSYLIFIDEFFSLARDRDRVLKRFEEQVGQMGSEDRMAVVAFDGRELTMLTSWTNSQRVVVDALRQARERRTYGMHRMAELRQNDEDRRVRGELRGEVNGVALGNQDDPELLDTSLNLGFGLDPVEVPYASRLTTQLERSINAAIATLRGFASPPGRKAMMILAGGWPFSPAAYTVNDADTDFSEAVRADADFRITAHGRLFSPLSDTANLLGYTLYPVDVPGLVRESRDASYRQSDTGRIASNYSGFAREIGHHASLQFLARETGGRPLINSQRDDLFTEVVADTRSYYWLGFVPQRAGDDSHHQIEIEMLRPGLKARFREGFLDFSRQTEQTMMVESSLLFGSPPSTTPLELRIARPEKKSGRLVVPLQVGIPMEEVAMLPIGDNLYGADLELRISVMDDRGERSDTPVAQVEIRGRELPEPGMVFRYVTDLHMRKKRHRVVVAVWDPVGGSIMSSSVEIDP